LRLLVEFTFLLLKTQNDKLVRPFQSYKGSVKWTLLAWYKPTSVCTFGQWLITSKPDCRQAGVSQVCCKTNKKWGGMPGFTILPKKLFQKYMTLFLRLPNINYSIAWKK